ncbi:MAG: energy transducer TonB [Mucilaginibacter polytrichastri]|nr:energy transducer TonB [Mucilaginibacter polytrichastri]
MLQHHEENNYPKAFLITGIILAVFLVASWFIIMGSPKQELGTGGILVNYGTVDEGMGTDYMSTEEPSAAENANERAPEKVVQEKEPTPQVDAEESNTDVVTQETEDAPEIAANSKKETKTVTTSKEKPKAEPKLNPNALYKGPRKDGEGGGDGTGEQPGNQGKQTGTTLTNNYDGTGSGNGGNIYGLPNRNFVSRPQVGEGNGQTGKIVVAIQVDKRGNIIYARAGERGTTITDASLLQKCEDAVRRSKLNALDNAPDLQEGVIVFVFKVK